MERPPTPEIETSPKAPPKKVELPPEPAAPPQHPAFQNSLESALDKATRFAREKGGDLYDKAKEAVAHSRLGDVAARFERKGINMAYKPLIAAYEHVCRRGPSLNKWLKN